MNRLELDMVEEKREMPIIEKDTFEEITMQNIQDAVNILNSFATMLDICLNERQKKGDAFLDLLYLAEFINMTQEINARWEIMLDETGEAFRVFGFSTEDLKDAFVKRTSKNSSTESPSSI